MARPINSFPLQMISLQRERGKSETEPQAKQSAWTPFSDAICKPSDPSIKEINFVSGHGRGIIGRLGDFGREECRVGFFPGPVSTLCPHNTKLTDIAFGQSKKQANKANVVPQTSPLIANMD